MEVFRLPDAAARYIAKEAGKRCQKALPKGVNGGRRWWWLSPAGRPKSIGTARLHFYPFNMIVSRIFDKTALAPYMTEEKAKFAEPAKFWVDTEMLF